jgi:CubicO group peptidase (beta-lactamase class C family)
MYKTRQKMLMRTKSVAVALLTMAFLASGFAQSLDKAKLDQFLDRLAEKHKGMGGLTLVKDRDVVYSHSFGYSYVSETEKKLATAATKYRIASITKVYTATMIFQLVEEGRLKMTDTLDKFFPQIPNAGKITIAHILAHRSGIPDIEQDGSWGHELRTKEEIIARIAQGRPDFEPGTQNKYSNSGYHLLGCIIEQVDAKPYADALKARITSKIGLKDTYSVASGTADPARNESRSYQFLGSWRDATELDFSVVAGAGSIVATTADLATFLQALFDGKLVSQASLDKMKTTQDGEGMGMTTFTFAGKTFYGESGGSFNSGAWVAYLPEEKLIFAYGTNAKIYPAKNVMDGVLDIYWSRPFEIPSFDSVEVSPDILDRYVGVYGVPGTPGGVTFKREGNTLFFQPPGNAAVPLEATAENKFKIDPAVFFEFDAAKGQVTIKRPQGERVLTKEK